MGRTKPLVAERPPWRRHSLRAFANQRARCLKLYPHKPAKLDASGKLQRLPTCNGPYRPLHSWKSRCNWNWETHCTWFGPGSHKASHHHDISMQTMSSPYHRMAAAGTNSRGPKGVQAGTTTRGRTAGPGSPSPWSTALQESMSCKTSKLMASNTCWTCLEMVCAAWTAFMWRAHKATKSAGREVFTCEAASSAQALW